MTPAQRDETLLRTLSAALGLPESRITEETSPDTVATWDSVNHLNLVLALEEAFGVAFTPEETLELTSMARIRRLLELKAA